MKVFERFTKQAKQVVVRAQGVARDRGDGRIGAEHLLIACFDVNAAVVQEVVLSSTVLREGLTDLDLAALRSVGVETHVAAAHPNPKGRRHIPFTGSGKQILVTALEEATTIGDRHIGVGHIMLGITKLPPTDRASRLLSECGVDPQDLRADLLNVMKRAS